MCGRAFAFVGGGRRGAERIGLRGGSWGARGTFGLHLRARSCSRAARAALTRVSGQLAGRGNRASCHATRPRAPHDPPLRPGVGETGDGCWVAAGEHRVRQLGCRTQRWADGNRMTGETSRILVELTQDEGDGALFLADVCLMLERLAVRIGFSLEVEARTARSRVYRLPVGAPFGQALSRELGIHRAQLVPRGSTTGRIVTAKVNVIARPPHHGAPDGSVLKTYNYVKRQVSLHETGEVLPLDSVLFGAT
jgi:hypothetical protein